MAQPDEEPCPVCGRPLIPGPSVNRHHLVPKLKGGKEAYRIHRICHSKLHSLWTETELARTYNDWAVIRADPRIQDFVRWIAKKPADFCAGNRVARSHKRPRRR